MSKLFDTAATGPWIFYGPTEFCIGDINGDGKSEVVVLDQTKLALGVFSYQRDGSGPGHLVTTLIDRGCVPGNGEVKPWALSSTDQLHSADIDGDGSDEIIIHNPGGKYIGVLKWNDAAKELQTLWKVYGTVPGANGVQGWALTSGDTLYPPKDVGVKSHQIVIDNPIVIHNPGAKFIGVLKWNDIARELQTLWKVYGTVPGADGVQGWALTSDDRLCRADVNGDARDEVVIAAPDALFMGVLEWDGSGLKTSWKVYDSVPGLDDMSGWQIFSGDLLYSADVDGDGSDEIVIHNPDARLIGVLKSHGPGLQMLSKACALVPGAGQEQGWDLTYADKICPANVDGDKYVEIAISAASDSYLGVLKWEGSELQTLWKVYGTVPPAQGGWALTASDLLYRAGLHGNGSDQLLIFASSANYIGILEWVTSELQTEWKMKGSVPAGSLALTENLSPSY